MFAAGRTTCRDCARTVECRICSAVPRGSRKATQICQRCSESLQVDKFLQTPKDEVTHFGALEALRLRRETTVTVLMVCCRSGLWEQPILQRIVEFARVPFVTSRNCMHYCELCDAAFDECPVKRGQQVQMADPNLAVRWEGCPGERLKYFAGDRFSAVDLFRALSGEWFFKVQVQDRRKLAPESEQAPEVRDTAALDTEELTKQRPCWKTCWAPLGATVEGRRPSPLMAHLQSKLHLELSTVVESGQACLISQAALNVAARLGERPETSLSRFREGLGLQGQLCSPADVDRALKLERVRDAQLPAKFLRGGHSLWLTREIMLELEEEHQQQKKGGRGRGKAR